MNYARTFQELHFDSYYTNDLSINLGDVFNLEKIRKWGIGEVNE